MRLLIPRSRLLDRKTSQRMLALDRMGRDEVEVRGGRGGIRPNGTRASMLAPCCDAATTSPSAPKVEAVREGDLPSHLRAVAWLRRGFDLRCHAVARQPERAHCPGSRRRDWTRDRHRSWILTARLPRPAKASSAREIAGDPRVYAARPSRCGAANSMSSGRGFGSPGSRAASPSSTRLPATNCAPSSATSRPTRTICPGCSCPSGRHSSLARPVNYIVRVAGETAKLGRVWPHMLRHSCGYYLADQGTDLRTMQDYLGHRDPKHTAHYTRVAGHRFGLW